MSSFEEFGRVYGELQKWKIAETEVSNAYLRLRRLIPGALNTPHAPTANQVWAVTEAALKRALDPPQDDLWSIKPRVVKALKGAYVGASIRQSLEEGDVHFIIGWLENAGLRIVEASSVSRPNRETP